MPTPIAVLALMLNALVWGLSWWPFREFQAAGLHPLWTTVGFFSVAVAAVFIAWPHALRELWRARSLWLLVLASGATNTFFNWAVTLGDVVRVVLLFYLMPLWSLLLARALLGERLTAWAGLRMALALGGAAVVLMPGDGSGFPLPSSLADWLGVAGGFSFALTNVLLKREAHQPRAAVSLALFGGDVAVAGAVASALAGAGLITWPALPSALWLLPLLAMALLFFVANLGLQYGARRLPAHVTAVVMLVEVPVAALSALWLGGGRLDGKTALGGLCILAAALLAAFGPQTTTIGSPTSPELSP